MQIKDIVNRDIVNLTNCEQEPIHIPGSIQPHGFLLALSPGALTIEFCSENVAAFLSISHTALLGKSIYTICEKGVSKLFEDPPSDPVNCVMRLAQKEFECSVHSNGTYIVVEAEPVFARQELTDVYEQTKLFLKYMEDTKSLMELCQLVAEGTRRITGYDRVMIYRFDEQYNGEIIAESKEEKLEPFFGLHYPHTDIPPQARELYIRNLLRVIVDVNYTPVPIYTIDNAPGKNLDLSVATLRSTSPIHVQYLHNMGVGATLTISLLHKGRLWGLIACHHYSAKNLSHEQRVAAKLQGHFITAQIDTRQLNEEYDIAKKCNEALENMEAQHFDLAEAAFEAIVASPQLLAICNAAGVAVLVNGRLYTGGTTPATRHIFDLINHLMTRDDASLETGHLGSIVASANDFSETAAGIIFHKIGIDNTDCIAWFRPQSVVEVDWAGDPTKAIIKNEKGLSPRNSFKLWKEVVQGRSKEWLQPEITAAASYAHALGKHVNLLRISEEEQKYRELSGKLKEANAELENINWISTHDLQEPLRKIQLMASRIMEPSENPGGQKVEEKIAKISLAANRMQTLLKDILHYTRIRNIEDELTLNDPGDLLQEILPDFEEVLNRSGGKIQVGELPKIDCNPFLIKQLFSNLLFNAIKFQKPGVAPLISVNADPNPATFDDEPADKRYNVLHFADNGIGFQQEFATAIFNVFTRLNNQSLYEGSGIGLALCKKIMQVHKGHITASGTPGEGATFHLYFPVQTSR